MDEPLEPECSIKSKSSYTATTTTTQTSMNEFSNECKLKKLNNR